VSTTDSVLPDTFEAAAGVRGHSPGREAWTRLTRSRLHCVCLAIVALYVLVALVSCTPLLDRMIRQVVGGSYEAPSFKSVALWLGTDIQGRSVLWRVLYGTRIALSIAVLASAIEIAFGVLFGILAGYLGGWIDALIIWLLSTVSTVPWILLVIALAYVLQGQTFFGLALSPLAIVILALGLTGWVGLCRLIRAEVMKLRERDYVVAARAVGASTPRILVRHILPNVFHLVLINLSLGAAGYMQSEVALSFLGLGISDRPSWGRMIDDAKLELLRGVWWQLVAATVALYVISQALNLLGDALRDVLDPRLRGVA
jgi:peptide/nickel transport system permease protein